MDPVSISAGIIAFVSAANALLILCYNVQSQLRNPPWTLRRLIEEVKWLRNLLEAVAASEAQQKGTVKQSGAALYTTLQAPLADCMTEVYSLNRKLRVFPAAQANGSTSKLESLVQAVRWTMSQDDIEKSLAKIERCKNALTLCLSSQNM